MLLLYAYNADANVGVASCAVVYCTYFPAAADLTVVAFAAATVVSIDAAAVVFPVAAKLAGCFCAGFVDISAAADLAVVASASAATVFY